MASRAASPKREEGRYTFPLWCILCFFLGILPSLALVVSAVRVFFPGSLFAKVVAGENFQVANRNVTREPQWFVRQAALERARHPPPPWAAAWPRPGSQPCPQLCRCGRGGGARGPLGEVRPMPRPGHSLGSAVCAGRCVCCSGVGCASSGGGENYPHLSLKVPRLEAKGRFLWR